MTYLLRKKWSQGTPKFSPRTNFTTHIRSYLNSLSLLCLAALPAGLEVLFFRSLPETVRTIKFQIHKYSSHASQMVHFGKTTCTHFRTILFILLFPQNYIFELRCLYTRAPRISIFLDLSGVTDCSSRRFNAKPHRRGYLLG